MVSIENIILNQEVKDYKEALEFISDNLFERGYVKETYKEALLTREENSPTGLPIRPWSVAIPHTDPEHVIKPCIFIIQLKNIIQFHEMGNPKENVDVKYLFGLVFTDASKQVSLLGSIIEMITNQEAFDKLAVANTKSDIYNIITKFIK